MKKHLNTDAISNELKGASLFFARPPVSPEPPLTPTTRPTQPSPIVPPTTETPTPTRTPGTGSTPRTAQAERTALPPTKRQMKRHAFEIYHDQYESLVRLAAAERMAGGPGSMSQMVREALDRLIAEGRASQG